jgi:hypothetical protein
MTQSATDMSNCTHGPKKDCAECLVAEMAMALDFASAYAHNRGIHGAPFSRCGFEVCMKARAVLEKALYVGPPEVPLDHGHPHEACEDCSGKGSFWKAKSGGSLSGSRELCSRCQGTGVQA